MTLQNFFIREENYSPLSFYSYLFIQIGNGCFYRKLFSDDSPLFTCWSFLPYYDTHVKEKLSHKCKTPMGLKWKVNNTPSK
jgi:hypothetical protein